MFATNLKLLPRPARLPATTTMRSDRAKHKASQFGRQGGVLRYAQRSQHVTGRPEPRIQSAADGPAENRTQFLRDIPGIMSMSYRSRDCACGLTRCHLLPPPRSKARPRTRPHAGPAAFLCCPECCTSRPYQPTGQRSSSGSGHAPARLSGRSAQTSPQSPPRRRQSPPRPCLPQIFQSISQVRFGRKNEHLARFRLTKRVLAYLRPGACSHGPQRTLLSW